MKKETVEKASKLLDEIKELKRINEPMFDKHISHFEFVAHYGELADYEKIEVPERYTKLMKEMLVQIIESMEKELEMLDDKIDLDVIRKQHSENKLLQKCREFVNDVLKNKCAWKAQSGRENLKRN